MALTAVGWALDESSSAAAAVPLTSVPALSFIDSGIRAVAMGTVPREWVQPQPVSFVSSCQPMANREGGG